VKGSEHKEHWKIA